MATQKKPAKVALKGDMTVQEAIELKGTLIKAISKSDAIEINFSDLEDLDTAIIQVLFAVFREALLQNKNIQFTGTYVQRVKTALAMAGFINGEQTGDAQVFSQFEKKVRKSL